MATVSRIKLRTDTTENWSNSLKPLYEGEIAISYDLVESKLVPGQYDKQNFRIKIGRGIDRSSSCLWRDAADLEVAHISDEDLQRIADIVKDQLGDIFVSKTEFLTVTSALENAIQANRDRIAALEARMADKVSATVSDAVLVLSTDNICIGN